MIKFVSGDILKTKIDYIAQGVAIGSQEGMGTGLALKISKKWTYAQKEFKKYTRNHQFKKGDIFIVKPNDNNPGIIYIATQPNMYYAKLSYLNRGIKNLVQYCKKEKITSVAIPRIGSGLGKLDWNKEVKPLLAALLEPLPTEFSIYEDFKNEYEENEE